MNYKKLLEGMSTKYSKDMSTRRYNLSEIISESYKVLYACDQESNLYKMVESHLADVRRNPSDMERLSFQLSTLKHVLKMVESKKLKDEELLVPEEKYAKVTLDEQFDWMGKEVTIDASAEDYFSEEEEASSYIGSDGTVVDYDKKSGRCQVKFSNGAVITIPAEYLDLNESALKEDDDKMTPEEMEDYWEKNKDNDPVLANYDSFYDWYKDSKDNGYVKEDPEDEDLLEDTDLTEEEVEELAKHLSEIRKNKKVAECDAPTKEEAPVTESKGRKLMRRTLESKVCTESKSWSDIKEGLKNFSQESSSKAFYKTFKKMSGKLQEGTALTRQESIALYKAANSAMTHLSVELEHNPEFLGTFRESVSLLAEDVAKVLGSLKNNKAPSKSTMKSLAKFAEAIILEADEEEEELPPIEDEEFIDAEETPAEESMEGENTEEVDEFDQEYADARVEMHKELAEEHADDENPEVAEKLAQDAAEIAELPGVTDEQIAEITGEENAPEEEQSEESEEGETEEDTEEAPAEEEIEESEEEEEITDEELAELKKHLMEMRATKKSK